MKKHDKNSLVETILPVLKSTGFSEASRKAIKIELPASLNVLPLGTFCLKLHRDRKQPYVLQKTPFGKIYRYLKENPREIMRAGNRNPEGSSGKPLPYCCQGNYLNIP